MNVRRPFSRRIRCGRLAAALLIAVASLGDAPAGDLRLLAPSAPGSNTDAIARALADGLQREDPGGTVEIVNVPGGGGLLGLAAFAAGTHDARLLVTGLTMIDAALVKRAPISIDRLTPIARLASEPYGLAVPDGSPFAGLDDLRTALLADPPKMAWAGGPSGGTDQVGTVLLGRALGIEVSALNYVAFLGPADAVAAAIDGKVAAVFVPVTELAAGLAASRLRLLAVASDRPVPGLAAPTLRDKGVDLVFGSWRGIVARADISVEERTALAYRIASVAATPEWQATVASRGWQPAFLAGDDFARFILSEQGRLERVLKTIGVLRRDPE